MRCAKKTWEGCTKTATAGEIPADAAQQAIVRDGKLEGAGPSVRGAFPDGSGGRGVTGGEMTGRSMLRQQASASKAERPFSGKNRHAPFGSRVSASVR
ncbi:MAG: hypothetical protein HUU20_15490 [Pirellulales bacterium]|nr:hypothetical protein [Pirellulales bacterium]